MTFHKFPSNVSSIVRSCERNWIIAKSNSFKGQQINFEWELTRVRLQRLNLIWILNKFPFFSLPKCRVHPTSTQNIGNHLVNDWINCLFSLRSLQIDMKIKMFGKICRRDGWLDGRGEWSHERVNSDCFPTDFIDEHRRMRRKRSQIVVELSGKTFSHWIIRQRWSGGEENIIEHSWDAYFYRWAITNHPLEWINFCSLTSVF